MEDNIKKSKNQDLGNTKKCGAIYMSAFAAFFLTETGIFLKPV